MLHNPTFQDLYEASSISIGKKSAFGTSLQHCDGQGSTDSPIMELVEKHSWITTVIVQRR